MLLDDLLNKKEDIYKIIEKNNGSQVKVFGSIVSGKATDQSDIDILVLYLKTDLRIMKLETISKGVQYSYEQRSNLCKQIYKLLKVVNRMNTAKDYIHLELQNASQSSMSFWENQTDDEVWNNVLLD